MANDHIREATKKIRLIDANYLVYKLIPNCPIEEGGIPLRDFNAHQKILKLYPTVDAVEVVHGRWQNNANNYPECDKCGYMPQYDPMIDDIWYSPYCPNCGAKMDGGKDNEM